MELKNTIAAMVDENYKARFAAEYWQTKIRYDKLHSMIVKYEAGKLNFTPKCSLDLLKNQAKAMGEYLYILEIRATIEGINLDA